MLRESSDLRRHRRREKQGLSCEWDEFADALYIRDEPHVEHAVRFIDHQDVDTRQQKLAAFSEVQEAARRRYQDIGAAGDLGFLIAKGDAADQEGDVQLVVDAIPIEALFDLSGKFARRLENERARHSRSSATGLQAG